MNKMNVLKIHLTSLVFFFGVLSMAGAESPDTNPLSDLMIKTTVKPVSCTKKSSGPMHQGDSCGVMDNDPIELAKAEAIPQVGQTAPDFELLSAEGKTFNLSRLLKTKPVVLQFGSLTCPRYRRQLPEVNKLMDKLGNEFHFVTIYTREAHPIASSSPYYSYVPDYERVLGGLEKKGGKLDEKNRQWAIPVEGEFLQEPSTYRSRAQYAKRSSKLHHPKNLMLVDDMNDSSWKKWGQLPNNVAVINKDQRIVYSQVWVIANHLRDFLENYSDSKTDRPKIRKPASLEK